MRHEPKLIYIIHTECSSDHMVFMATGTMCEWSQNRAFCQEINSIWTGCKREKSIHI